MTNNGDIINKMMRAGNRHEKEYKVTVDKPITPGVHREDGGGSSDFRYGYKTV